MAVIATHRKKAPVVPITESLTKMTDAETNGAPATNGNASSEPKPNIQVLAQYIKDLSFENPKSPASLQGPGENPKMKIEVNVNAQKVAENTFESAIIFNAKASNDDGALYELELIYAGVMRLENVPENMLQPVLLINCPTLTFPFLRRIVADLTREGGFPPLFLDPIDFGGLYAKNLAQQQEQAASGDAPAQSS